MEDRILNLFDGGWKVGDQVMGLGVQSDNHKIGQAFRDSLVGFPRGEDPVVHTLQVVLLEPADRLRRTPKGADDSLLIEGDQSVIALHHLADFVDNSHSDVIIAWQGKEKKVGWLSWTIRSVLVGWVPGGNHAQDW